MKYGLKQFKKDFPNDQACLQFAFDTLHSKECNCGGEYRAVEGRKQFYCSKCRYQIAPLSKTIFRKSPTPLLKWFTAIFMTTNKASVTEIQKEIGVTWKCAWRMRKIVASKIQSGRMMSWNVKNAKQRKQIASFISLETSRDSRVKNVLIA